ncbi:MAG: DUF3017 domain-containing protein [Actinomycetota bacterium]
MATPGTRRRPPFVVRQWPMVLVLAGMGAGMGLMLADADFRRGSVVLSGAFCLAAVLRAALPDTWAGLLRSRSRWLDVSLLLLLGVGGLLASLALIHDWQADLVVRWLQGST